MGTDVGVGMRWPWCGVWDDCELVGTPGRARIRWEVRHCWERLGGLALSGRILAALSGCVIWLRYLAYQHL
jgi:hypothetical protein